MFFNFPEVLKKALLKNTKVRIDPADLDFLELVAKEPPDSENRGPGHAIGIFAGEDRIRVHFRHPGFKADPVVWFTPLSLNLVDVETIVSFIREVDHEVESYFDLFQNQEEMLGE